jgi:hypothetical protein
MMGPKSISVVPTRMIWALLVKKKVPNASGLSPSVAPNSTVTKKHARVARLMAKCGK